MAFESIPYESICNKKTTLASKTKCLLGFHDWLYLPFSIRIETRHVCVRKGCGAWKDCWGIIRGDRIKEGIK